MEAKTIIKSATSLISDVLIPLVFLLCLLYFFWGVVKYVRSSGQGKDEGKRVMIWGIVALFVALSIWGIVQFIQIELNISPIQNVQKQGSGGESINSIIRYQ